MKIWDSVKRKADEIKEDYKESRQFKREIMKKEREALRKERLKQIESIAKEKEKARKEAEIKYYKEMVKSQYAPRPKFSLSEFSTAVTEGFGSPTQKKEFSKATGKKLKKNFSKNMFLPSSDNNWVVGKF